MLEDKITIVTGGAVGIGKAIAERFVDDGATVVIADVDEETGAATADELDCRSERCNVREYDQVEALSSRRQSTSTGRLDVIVNNAGIGSETSVEEMELEEWEAVIETNLDGVMHGTKAAIPHLEESDGCIINLGSIYGLVGGKGCRVLLGGERGRRELHPAGRGRLRRQRRSRQQHLSGVRRNTDDGRPARVRTVL